MVPICILVIATDFEATAQSTHHILLPKISFTAVIAS